MKTTIYLTKYALTKGILKMDAEIDDEGWAVVGKNNNWNGYNGVYGKKDYELNKSNAIDRANELRNRKIENLKSQIEKLSNLKFDL